jgi:HAMP domain-containing protein
VRDAERSLVDAEQRVRARAEHTADSVRDDVAIAFSQSIVLFVAGAAGAMAVSVWLTRSVSAPVRELASGMEAVASGRFDHALRLAPSRRDEFGGLAANFATMTRRPRGARPAARRVRVGRVARAQDAAQRHRRLRRPRRRGALRPVTPSSTDVLRTVEGQTQPPHAARQRLLDVSRFQAGAGAIVARPLRLARFLAELERAHRVLAEQRELAFALVADPELPAAVRWDATGWPRCSATS